MAATSAAAGYGADGLVSRLFIAAVVVISVFSPARLLRKGRSEPCEADGNKLPQRQPD